VAEMLPGFVFSASYVFLITVISATVSKALIIGDIEILALETVSNYINAY
jgi:hypothetical protein